MSSLVSIVPVVCVVDELKLGLRTQTFFACPASPEAEMTEKKKTWMTSYRQRPKSFPPPGRGLVRSMIGPSPRVQLIRRLHRPQATTDDAHCPACMLAAPPEQRDKKKKNLRAIARRDFHVEIGSWRLFSRIP
jgi:hypothetical protein